MVLDGYSVTDSFFDECCRLTSLNCNFDRFANNLNAKTTLFNSSSHCVGTSGVDSFNYHWGFGVVNWLFPPPDLIMKTVNHLKLCNAQGLLVTPEWTSSAFYPKLLCEPSQFVKGNFLLKGQVYF